jgi:hypothetical protein
MCVQYVGWCINTGCFETWFTTPRYQPYKAQCFCYMIHFLWLWRDQDGLTQEQRHGEGHCIYYRGEGGRQERQCTYNVTVGRVHETIVAVEKQWVLHIGVCVRVWVSACMCVRVYGCTGAGVCFSACSLTYPAYNAYVPHCLRPLWHHQMFRHYVINYDFREKNLLKINCVFSFPLQLLSKTFLILRRNKRDIVINVKSLHVKYQLFLSDFNKSWIFSTDFRKKKAQIYWLKSIQAKMKES